MLFNAVKYCSTSQNNAVKCCDPDRVYKRRLSQGPLPMLCAAVSDLLLTLLLRLVLHTERDMNIEKNTVICMYVEVR